MKILLQICFFLLFSLLAHTQNNELWVRDLNKHKEYMIPRKSFETYFRLPIEKLPILTQKESILFNSEEYKLNGGYIGGLLSFDSIKEDSLCLMFKSYFSLAPENNQTYKYFVNYNDIIEIQLQRTHNKLLENIWVYGGLVGGSCLLVSPLIYFFDNKNAGIALFSTGIAATTASIISYKLYFGFDKYDKLKFEFFVK